MTLVDQDARCRAMTDFSSILLMEAAAGTGKTSLMAGRVAMMLAAGHPPGDIAAITFTELAASQLARRIRETVDTLLTGDVPAFLQAVVPEGLSEQQRNALVAASPRLDELTATTIHGFCQVIIRSHGVQAGLDPGARVVDATVADNLFMAELSAWFSQQLAFGAAEGDPIVVLAEEIPLQVVDLIRALASLRRKHPDARPIPPLPAARRDIDFVQAVDDFDQWQRSIEPQRWLAEIASELRRLAERYQDCLAEGDDFGSLWRLCDPGAGRLFERKGLQLKTYDEAARGFGAHRTDANTDEGRTLYETVVIAWSELVGHIASTLVCSLSASLDQLLESYQARKRAAAVLDFDDLLIHVRSLIRDHEEVRQAIGQRYRFILVDEFQDTDGIQNEILFSIAATEVRPARWEESQLRPGALFLVGDPKQAIYRFRGADIEAYELCRRLIEGQDHGAVLEITANFRSLSPIIDHANACFEPVFAKPSQPRYVALAATLFEASHQLPCVARFTVEVATEGRIYAEMFREAEAERGCRHLRSLDRQRLDKTRRQDMHGAPGRRHRAAFAGTHGALALRTGARATRARSILASRPDADATAGNTGHPGVAAGSGRFLRYARLWRADARTTGRFERTGTARHHRRSWREGGWAALLHRPDGPRTGAAHGGKAYSRRTATASPAGFDHGPEPDPGGGHRAPQRSRDHGGATSQSKCTCARQPGRPC
jgi:CRISPR-associated exonuclease Cas4